MEIVVKTTLTCQGYWNSKCHGVIFVEKEEHIKPLFQLLVEQDDYWERDKSAIELIKIVPKEIKSSRDLEQYCSYVGKTDI